MPPSSGRKRDFPYVTPQLKLHQTPYTVQAIELKDSNARPAIIYLPTTLTENPHFMRDLARYPAAVSAVLFAPQLLSLKYGRRISEERAYLDYTGDLLRWRDLFSYKGKSYSNLNKTLDSVQSCVLNGLLPYLPFVTLERAIADQDELEFYLTAISAFAGPLNFLEIKTRPGVIADSLRILQQYLKTEIDATIFQRASASEYEEALDLFCRLTERPACFFSRNGQDVNHVRSKLRQFFQYLGDYRERRSKHLVSLVKRAVRWHRGGETGHFLPNDGRHESYEFADRSSCVAEPPFSVPLAGLRFLATVGDICDEGAVMRHCARAYIGRAMSGKAFLFHFDHDGCHATVELNAQGKLVQVSGPRNEYNQACECIEKKLGNIEIW